jgi:hypothetical protein
MENTRVDPKVSRLVPPSAQQLRYCQAAVDGSTTMFSESVCQVSRRWDDVGSFYTHLFGVMYMTPGEFYNGSEKQTASVH